MAWPDEFRTGQLSIPSTDADDLPPGCLACPFLSYKEFSVGSGAGPFYYYCAYTWSDNPKGALPPCLQGQA